jgi:FkbM family methyltransferase
MNLINRIRQLLAHYDISLQRVGIPQDSPIKVLDLLLDRIPSSRGPDFQLIQIGANDGCSNDPVRKYVREFGWSGLLVEPIPSVFEKLTETYRGIPNIKLENCAVASVDGTVSLYRVRPDAGLPTYAQELASFDKRIILKQRRTVPDIARHISTINVPAKSVRSLFEQHAIRRVNLLVSDTEGFDYEVLKMVFETQVLPDIILFEWTHLRHVEKIDCARLLVERGYCYMSIERDTLAVRSTLVDGG